jgi:hypothetical protein
VNLLVTNNLIIFNIIIYFTHFEKFIDSITTNLSQVDYNNLKDKKWRLLLEKDQSNIYSIENIGRKIAKNPDLSFFLSSLIFF